MGSKGVSFRPGLRSVRQERKKKTVCKLEDWGAKKRRKNSSNLYAKKEHLETLENRPVQVSKRTSQRQKNNIHGRKGMGKEAFS